MLCYERETNFRGPELDRDMGTFLADHFRLQRFLFNLIVLVLSIRYSLFCLLLWTTSQDNRGEKDVVPLRKLFY